MKKLIIITLLFVLAGCAPTLTKEGAQVRKINAHTAKDCKFLGIMNAKWDWAGAYGANVQGAYIVLRNKVAANGGNCFVPTTEASIFVQADYYHCD